MRLVRQPFVAFDTESTGHGPADKHAIVEIGAVRIVNGVVTETFETLVNPGREIPPFVSRLHGITDSMVENAPDIKSALLDCGGFLDFIASDPLVAHNAPFDMTFMNAAVVKLTGRKLPNTVIDTLRIARKRLPELRNHRLETVAEHYNIHFPAHTALGDALMAAGIFTECLLADLGAGVSDVEEFCKKYKFEYRNSITERTADLFDKRKRFKPLRRSDYFDSDVE
jgi:DNA polymerase-3 subunit epsilon